MKVQSIILICMIGIYQRVDGSDGKLTRAENEERLKTCGMEFLLQPSKDENGVPIAFPANGSWLLYVDQGRIKNLTNPKTLGFPISKRHVIANSQVVFTDDEDKHWRLDNTQFNQSTCTKENHADLPQHIVDNLKVVTAIGDTGVLKGRTFEICVHRTEKFNVSYTFILLEVANASVISKHIPCVADETTDFKMGDEVHEYSFFKGIMEHHRVKIAEQETGRGNDHSLNVYTQPAVKLAGDRGGPLVLNYNGKATVLGSKCTPSEDKSLGNYYFGMRRFQRPICEYSGVCEAPPTTPAPPTTDAPTPDPSITRGPESSTMKSRPPPPKLAERAKEGNETETECDYPLDGDGGVGKAKDDSSFFFEKDSWDASSGSMEHLNFLLVLLIWIWGE